MIIWPHEFPCRSFSGKRKNNHGNTPPTTPRTHGYSFKVLSLGCRALQVLPRASRCFFMTKLPCARRGTLHRTRPFGLQFTLRPEPMFLVLPVGTSFSLENLVGTLRDFLGI
jgi:hypothetical protein